MSRILGLVFFLLASWPVVTQANADLPATEKAIAGLQKPMYTPFVEHYILEELKQLRKDQAATKHEMLQQITDREHHAVDRAITYATDTVTYFFYLIAAVSSALVLVGWNSFRDIKERVHSLADEEITKVVQEYEKRLASIEKQMQQKTKHIRQNREEIELAREMQALWLRAQQDSLPSNKIIIYDEILKLRPKDTEALTYKADAVLELNEPQWAVNLCRQALTIDPRYGFALYQMACAFSLMGKQDEAVDYLRRAIELQPSFAREAAMDPALDALKNTQSFQNLADGNGKLD